MTPAETLDLLGQIRKSYAGDAAFSLRLERDLRDMAMDRVDDALDVHNAAFRQHQRDYAILIRTMDLAMARLVKGCESWREIKTEADELHATIWRQTKLLDSLMRNIRASVETV